MATPQLTFSLNNPGAPDTVYVSAEAADNKLTLVLGSNVAASLTAGTVAPINQAGAGSGSLLYLDLTLLGLTSAELSAISITTDGWTSTPYYSSTSQLIGFSPTAPVSVAASGSVSLALGGFTLATQPSTPTVGLNVTYFRITGVTQQSIPGTSNFGVAVTLPPDKHDKDLQTAIVATLTPNQVVNCPTGGPQLANSLVLTLSPGATPSSIKAVSGTSFTLSFIYAQDANGFGAMMTPAQVQAASGFQVTAGQGVGGWTITPVLSAQNPYWTLTPPVGQPILGQGGESSLSFDVTGLVTNFQPGPTVVLLSYDDVPGYKSGTYSILAQKLAHVSASDFKAKPPVSTLTNGVAQITLSWKDSDATQLTLQPLGQDVTGTTHVTATISTTTRFSLIAEGQRPGNIDNTMVLDCTAYVEPVINSFTASPSAIYQDDFPCATALAWNVDTAGQVALSSSVTGLDPNNYNAVGTVSKTLAGPQMLTLTPDDSSGFTEVSRSVIVPAFIVSAAVASNGLDGSGVAAPANAPFVAMAVPSTNSVVFLSVVTFRPLATVTVGARPLGLAFSPDGSTLYVANSGDGTVSLVGVVNTDSSQGYTFSVSSTVQVGGAPQQVATGSDGSAWVSIDNGGAAGSVVKISEGAVATTLAVGIAPRGVAVTPSNGMAFVANSGSGSVSVIGNGTTPVLRAPISGLQTPQGVAVSPDGAVLLIATQGDSSVIGVQVAYYATAPRSTFQLPDAPSTIVAFPDGNYAVAGCGASAVLLNYANGTSTQTPLAGPAVGVGVTPDNGMALVSVAGQSGVSVLTFAQYAQVGHAVASGGSVTSVAVTPDAANALVWYDQLVTVTNAPPPMTGVSIYQTANGVSTAVLAGVAVADLAISPGAEDDAFYLAPFRQSSISVYTTSTTSLIATIPLPAKKGVASRSAVRLAISTDGATLFALTNDGSNTFSVVVFAADLTAKTFTVLADVAAFTCQYTPLALYLAAAPDGSAAYTVDPIGAVLYAVQQSGKTYALSKQTIALPAYSAPGGLVVLPDGSAAYAFAMNGSSNIVCTIALPEFTGVLTYLPDGQGALDLSAITASPDSTKLLGADLNFAGVRIFDAASLRIIQTLSWQSGVVMPYGVAVSPDGSRIFTANARSANLAIAEQVQAGA